MKKISNDYIFLAVFIGIVYLITSDIIITFFVGMLISVYCFTFMFKKMAKKRREIELLNEQNGFVSSFIVSLNVSNSLEYALENALEHANSKLKEELKLNSKVDVIDQLKNLEMYFNSIHYAVFINLIKMFQDTGGNILQMSEHYLPLIKKMQIISDQNVKLFKGKLIEFLTLWGFSFAIILFCRLGLHEFYSQTSQSLFFQMLIIAIFIFAIFSFHLHVMNYLQGDKAREEKSDI